VRKRREESTLKRTFLLDTVMGKGPELILAGLPHGTA
jgi:hypothetical protein